MPIIAQLLGLTQFLACVNPKTALILSQSRPRSPPYKVYGYGARYMELKREISRVLYLAIREKYERGWYRDAILAAITCLEDCIREKANFERDQILINPESCFHQAFGNIDPLIKINERTAIAHLYEQQGFAQIVLGIHQGIRTPRIHGELCDDEKTTNTIIVFIDYLIQRIQAANG